MYDLDALYLYEYCGYNVGKIEKINDKTIRMSRGYRISKDDFEKKCYKLTKEETAIFQHEVIKKISSVDKAVREMNQHISLLKKALDTSLFVDIKTDELQKEIDDLAGYISMFDLNPIKLNNKTYEFNTYGTNLKLKNEDEE